MPAALLPIQQLLRPALPTIEGNVDYRRLREQLLRMDQLLLQSGLEAQFIADTFEQWKAGTKFKSISPKAQRTVQFHARRALRCNIARTLILEDFRGFAIRLADSPLFQHFCGLDELDRVHVPSKSTLQRYAQWSDEAAVRRLVDQLTQQAHLHPRKLRLRGPLDLEACFLDTTCVQANIHYPVDWVLLRDATRTLMKAITLIRAQGLRHRMEEPALFIRRMNILAMEMTHTWNEKDSKKQRKKVLPTQSRSEHRVLRWSCGMGQETSPFVAYRSPCKSMKTASSPRIPGRKHCHHVGFVLKTAWFVCEVRKSQRSSRLSSGN